MSMWHREVIAGIALVASPALAFAGQQPAAGQTSPSAQPATAAIGECAQAQPRLMQIIDAANTRLEAARQSNSPGVMRATMDDLQGAFGSLRAQLASCAALQAATPADAHAGHAMPGAASVQQSPAARPGTPIMQPGSTHPAPGGVNQNTPVPAGAPADPHAGHAAPGAAPAAPPAQPPRQPAAPATQPQGAAPPPSAPGPAAGGHAGHAMPAAGNLVRDPRCTAGVTPESAPRAEHAGQSYYFCSERDRQLFVADPVTYLQGSAAQPAAPGRTTDRPSAAARSASPAAADPHAGHVMPGASQSAAPARGSSAQPRTAPPQSAAPDAPAAAGHAGHAMPSAPRQGGTTGRSSQPPAGAAPSHATAGAAASGGAAAARPTAPLSSGRMPITAVTELKCDGRVDPKTAPRMLHGGRMYYFCSAEERAEFAKNPEKYVTAPPSQSAPAHAH